MKFLKEEGYQSSDRIFIFDKKQINALIFCLIGSLVLFYVMSKSSYKSNDVIFKTLATLNLTVIFLRVLNYIIFQKTFKANYALPLHLCSYNVLLCFFAAWTMNAAVLDFIYAMSPMAALLALIFPESDAAKYPHFNFRSIEYYYSHTCLIITPLIPVFFFGFKPDLKYFSAFIIIFSVMIILAGFTDYITDGNYMFLCYGPEKTPLKIIEEKFGKTLYRIALILLFTILYFIMHLIYLIY